MSQKPDNVSEEEWAFYLENPLEHCVSKLSDSKEFVRYNAIDIIRGLGKDGVGAIEPLANLLVSDEAPHNRAHIAFTLAELSNYLSSDQREVLCDILEEALIHEHSEDPKMELQDALDRIPELPYRE